MKENFFEEFHRKKEQLKLLILKAYDNAWIDEVRRDELINSLDSDVLTIGVIGQMKCGKSTFLNSFVFEDDVLPAATTPMTAALSLITYGPEKKLKAEFYTKDEWYAQKEMASRSLEEAAGNLLLESKIKAAKELVDKSKYLGNSLEAYLGQIKEDTFDNLVDYVGAEGKYISITKAVTLYYPKEYLKGVEIVDTPGFNDPIVSREERTKDFLQRAHVVLLMLYAGRPFDSTDRSILFKNVGQCGTGKVLIGINKYDIPYENGETEAEIVEYVKKELRKACNEEDDQALVDIIQQTDPIPLSAEMALMSELPMSKIVATESYNFAYKRHCDNFEISSQQELRQRSHIDDLMSAVKVMIEKEKAAILSAKPINAILAAGNKKKEEINSAIRVCESTISACSATDDELEEKKKNFERASKRIHRRIESIEIDLDDLFKKIIRKATTTLEDDIDVTCDKLIRLVDEIGLFQDFSKIESRWNNILNMLITRKLKRHVEELQAEGQSQIRRAIADFVGGVEEILYRYVDKDFDVATFIKEAGREIEFDAVDNDLFSIQKEDGKYEEGFISSFLIDFFKGATFGIGPLVVDKVANVLDHQNLKNSLCSYVEEIRTQTDVAQYLEAIKGRKDVIIESIKTRFFDNCLTPIQQQLEDVIADVDGRQQKLQQAQEELTKLRKDLTTVDAQIEETKKMIQ